MEDVDPWTAIGVIAAAVGIVASVGSAMRWVRARWQRTRTLRNRLLQVEHENGKLVAAAVAISEKMLAGITWRGWPPSWPNGSASTSATRTASTTSPAPSLAA